MHIELLELNRRVQGRVPLPWFELNDEIIRRHIATGEPLYVADGRRDGP